MRCGSSRPQASDPFLPRPRARSSISSQERLNPFPRAGDEMLPGRDRPDEHRAVEGLTCHEVRELRGGVPRVLHAQQPDLSQVLESRRQGFEHLTGSPIEVFRRESREGGPGSLRRRAQTRADAAERTPYGRSAVPSAGWRLAAVGRRRVIRSSPKRRHHGD